MASKLLKLISMRVRQERTLRNMSQQQVAERANVSRRMLAAIESEGSNVSLATLDRIAAALDLPFADLLRASATAAPASPVVAWQGRTKGSRGVLLHSAPATRNVELWEWTLAPGDRYRAEPDRPGMREQLYVVRGTLILDLNGKEQRLNAGSSFMFDSDREYEYRNPGKTTVHFLKAVVD